LRQGFVGLADAFLLPFYTYVGMLLAEPTASTRS
jgi:hypothetical protein